MHRSWLSCRGICLRRWFLFIFFLGFSSCFTVKWCWRLWAQNGIQCRLQSSPRFLPFALSSWEVRLCFRKNISLFNTGSNSFLLVFRHSVLQNLLRIWSTTDSFSKNPRANFVATWQLSSCVFCQAIARISAMSRPVWQTQRKASMHCYFYNSSDGFVFQEDFWLLLCSQCVCMRNTFWCLSCPNWTSGQVTETCGVVAWCLAWLITCQASCFLFSVDLVNLAGYA